MTTKKLFILFLILITGINMANSQKLTTVPSVDLEKYAGKWYEIASYPHRFQAGCSCTSAEYVNMGKYIKVINRCTRDGKETSITGKAFIKKNTGNSQLRVRFFWPFSGKYWIIGLADDYSWAIVSHPSLNYFWILSRTPEMDENLYNELIGKAKTMGIDPARINRTEQKKCSSGGND